VVVTARYGTVSFSSDYTRILMDLRDGEIHDMDVKSNRSYRRLRFERHRVAIPASGFGFERSDASMARRDDRTMRGEMMRRIVDSVHVRQQEKIETLDHRIVKHLSGYFRGRPEYFSAAPNRAAVRTADDSLELRPSAIAPVFTREDSLGAIYRTLTDVRQLQTKALAEMSGIKFDDKYQDKYLVEIYKKYSIPVACLVFVLIGAPLGTMARRGGFGMGAGLSLGFFLFYWANLIGGEKLADRDVLSPFWGMWLANIVLGISGILLTIRMAKESTVIDWSVLSRFVPKSFRTGSEPERRNPHEA